MPVVPNAIERTVLLRLNQGPGPMLDFLGALSMRAASGAVQLGVFDVLEAGPRTADEVAAAIDGDARGTRLLLTALESTGYVRRRGDRFELTRMTSKWLPLVRDGVPFFDRVVREWDHLERCVHDPSAWRDDKSRWTAEDWMVFQKGMLAFARLSMRDVVTKASIPSSARRLLDLGGGHGAHAIAFAKAHPALSATVFDVAESAPSAERLIAAEAMQERVKFETGDFWYDDIGAGYDVVFLANVVHGYRADQNQKLFEIVAKALSPGGRVIVLEQLPREKQMGKVGAALASLMAINMFLSREAETYSADRIGAWMRTAGFVDTRVKRFVRTPGLGLVIAKLSS